MALVLSRREDESIIIGEDIVVTVVEIGPGSPGGRMRARLAITAPKHVPVHRAEVAAAIREQEKQRFET